MKVLVLGANGKTGEAITLLAFQEGHEVTAFVHALEPIDFQCTYVRIIRGDARDVSLVREAVAGQDAVLDTIGDHFPFWDSHVEAECARNVMEAMQGFHVHRLIALSRIGEGESNSNVHTYYRYLLVPTVLHGVMKDKKEMEDEVRPSQLEWTIIRPASFIEGEPRGVCVIDETTQIKARPITRTDVARFMVDQLRNQEYVRKIITIGGAEQWQREQGISQGH